MNITTLSQAKSILEVFDRMDLTNEHVFALLESGFLNDLIRATKIDLSAVNPEAYQKALGIEPYVFRILLGGPENTDQIVAKRGFPLIVETRWVNQINFPIVPRHDEECADIELIEPGRPFTEKEGMGIIASAGLMVPTHEHAIRFAEQHGENPVLKRKQCILFLQATKSEQSAYPLYLRRTTEQTELRMHIVDGVFSAEHTLAGVRPCWALADASQADHSSTCILLPSEY